MSRIETIIIGGGVIGCALAEALARAGQSVVVLEAQHVAAEASSVAAGMIAPQIEAHGPGPFLELSLASRALFSSTISRLEHDTGLQVDYQQHGLLCVVMDAHDAEEADARLLWQVEQGLNVQRLSREDVLQREPDLSPQIRGALLFHDDRHVNSELLTRAYAQSAQQQGARIIEGRRVTQLVHAHGRATGVLTDDGEQWEAVTIVDAAGSWSAFDTELPFAIPVAPVKGQIIAFRDAAALVRRPVKWGKTYCVPRSDGMLMVGTTVEHVGYDRAIREAASHEMHEQATQICPRLADYAVEEAWVSFRPTTPDQRPLLGPTPLEGFYLATGHFRNGILLAPITAQLLSELILEGHTSMALNPFHLSRFDTPILV